MSEIEDQPKQLSQAELVLKLREQGFDGTLLDCWKGQAVLGCSQCVATAINGTACHEHGCPNIVREDKEIEDNEEDRTVLPLDIEGYHLYELKIDGPLFRDQRALVLATIHTLATRCPPKKSARMLEILEGLTGMLDEIADQAHDKYGIDCLMEDIDEPA